MNAWKLGYATFFSMGLALAACGSSDDDDGGSGAKGGSGGGKSTGKSGSSNGGSGGTSSAGTSSAGTSSAGKSGGSGGSTGGTNATAGTGPTSGTGGVPAELCDEDTLKMGLGMETADTGCPAADACLQPCLDSYQDCFGDGGACEPYFDCAIECQCDQTCISSECIDEVTGCSTCFAGGSATCLLDCLDELQSCM